MSSSPDPLMFVTSSPTKSTAARRPTKRGGKPLAQLSPNVQRSDPFLEIPDLSICSPSKSMTMMTPRAGGSSPWRIKVTVEAEPHDQDENSLSSPTGARSGRITTQTTTVPLNDAEGSSPIKRRGRPRKSDTLPGAALPLNDAAVSSPGKRRGRPRKSDTTPAMAAQTTAVPLNDTNDSSPTKRRAGGRVRNATPVRRARKSITRSPGDHDTADSSLSDASFQPTRRGAARSRKSLSKDMHVPEPIRADAMYGPRSPADVTENLIHDLSELPAHTSGSRTSVGQRRRSARYSEQFETASDAPAAQPDENEQTPKASSSRQSGDDADMWRSMISHHEYESESTAEEDGSDDDLDIVMPDQTIGETTILHSEEFSMVSLDSLPSMQAARISPRTRKSPAEEPQRAIRPTSLRTDPIPLPCRQNIGRKAISSPLPEINDSVASVSYMPSSPPVRFPARTPSGSQKIKSPFAPPAVQQVESSPSKAETPKLVNVVKAGIALQGVVNGNNRGTQDRRPSDDVREEAQRARLDEMFSEFESGMRRELQAGLRLGQQLAERARSRVTTRESTHEPSREPSLERSGTRVSGDGDVFEGPSTVSNQDSSNHRLPTPDDKDDYSLSSPPPPPSQPLVEQPDLTVNAAQVQLISPARSQASPDAEPDMSPSEDTPPSSEDGGAEESHEYQDSVLQRNPGEPFEEYWERRREAISQKIEEASSSQVIVISSDNSESSEISEDSEKPADGGDIWEEEASRSSDTRAAAKREKRAAAKQAAEPPSSGSGASNTRRGRLNRAWQRNDSSNSKNPQENAAGTPSETSSQNRPQGSAKGKGRASPSDSSNSQDTSDGGDTPDTGSDEDTGNSTGLFWPSNTPQSSSTRRESSKFKGDKLDLSVLMAMDESSPREAPLATPPKLQPSKAPYNMGTGLNSPVKGSPLKQQVLFSSPSAVNSSPYHRIQHNIESSMVRDEETMAIEDSMTSDIRQLRPEQSSYRSSGRIRAIPPSPAVFAEEDRMVQRQIENELTPRRSRMMTLDVNSSRNRRPLFADVAPATTPHVATEVTEVEHEEQQSESSVSHSTPEETEYEEERMADASVGGRSSMTALHLNRERKPLFEQRRPIGVFDAPAPHTAPETVQEQSSGLFGRLWSAIGSSNEPAAPVVPMHPLAERYGPLPRVAPWTKTHWDTLSRIYERYKRHPEQFSPNDPLHKALLAQKHQFKPGSSKMEPVSYFSNTQMMNWNYVIKITPELLICCAIFMQQLMLKDAAEYRRVTGREIKRGNFMQKDRTGDPITLRDVVGRMFGVVGGEMIRRDEKKGLCIRRDLDQLKIKWPNVPGWWDENGKFLHD